MFDKGETKLKGFHSSNQQLWSVECTHKPLIQQSLTAWSILKCLINPIYPIKLNTRLTELGKSVHLATVAKHNRKL